MRMFYGSILLALGFALTVLLGSVVVSTSDYRDKWYSPKDFERGEWACLKAHGR